MVRCVTWGDAPSPTVFWKQDPTTRYTQEGMCLALLTERIADVFILVTSEEKNHPYWFALYVSGG